jgi:hypothetical protein
MTHGGSAEEACSSIVPEPTVGEGGGGSPLEAVRGLFQTQMSFLYTGGIQQLIPTKRFEDGGTSIFTSEDRAADIDAHRTQSIASSINTPITKCPHSRRVYNDLYDITNKMILFFLNHGNNFKA